MAFFGGRQLLPLFFFNTTVDSVVGILAAALCVCVCLHKFFAFPILLSSVHSD